MDIGQLAQYLRSLQPKVHSPTSRETRGKFEETRGSGEKWCAAISLKRVKIEEQLLW